MRFITSLILCGLEIETHCWGKWKLFICTEERKRLANRKASKIIVNELNGAMYWVYNCVAESYWISQLVHIKPYQFMHVNFIFSYTLLFIAERSFQEEKKSLVVMVGKIVIQVVNSI